MSMSLQQVIDGTIYEVMSDSWYTKEPCVVVPISIAESLDATTIGTHVKACVEMAKLASAHSFADWLVGNGGKSETIPEWIIEDYTKDIDNLMLFSGNGDKIDLAIQRLENTKSRMLHRTQRKAKRSALQSVYDKTFVMLGRRDGFRCAICKSSESDLQIDHVNPVIKGGSNDLDNLQLLCSKCNMTKSDK